MTSKRILPCALAFAALLLASCDEPKKSATMLGADRLFSEAKVAGASDLAPIEYYQAEKKFALYEAAWKGNRFLEADTSAALAGYLSEAALVRVETRRLQESIKASELGALKAEKETSVAENQIKDAQLHAKDMAIMDRNQFLAARDQKLKELDGKYRLLYAEKMKDEEAALKNVDALSTQIAQMQKELGLSQGELSKLSAEDRARRKLALDQVALLGARLLTERERAEKLQQDNETLAQRADVELLRTKANSAIGSARLVKAKAESMGAKEGAPALFKSAEKTLESSLVQLGKGGFQEARASALTAAGLYNDAITAANGLYLQETERLKKAREEIKKVFSGLEDTEITDEKGRVKIIMRGALFEFNRSVLLSRFHDRLDKLAEILVRYHEFPISVEGHTDNIGKDTYNLNLSSERSGAITTYLIDQGRLEGKRIVALGYGKSRPMESNETEEGRARNRRVEIILQRNFAPGDRR
jgi:outer membrane protein OmpA-like peptidoglycan-associated protein